MKTKENDQQSREENQDAGNPSKRISRKSLLNSSVSKRDSQRLPAQDEHRSTRPPANPALACPSPVTKWHRQGGLRKRKLTAHSSGSCESEIWEPARSGGGPPSGHQLLLRPHSWKGPWSSLEPLL